jgi:hypothetical protein
VLALRKRQNPKSPLYKRVYNLRWHAGFFLLLGVPLYFLILVAMEFKPAIDHPVGKLVPSVPQIKMVSREGWQIDNSAFVRPVAQYQAMARVLGTEHYFLPSDANDVAPYDIALGWEEMSDSKLINRLRISQMERFYFYSYKDSSIRKSTISLNSANVHIVPANDAILKKVAGLHPGDIVSLKGYLADVEFSDGEKWKTSVSLGDEGAGACEILWLADIKILTEEFLRVER